MEAQITAQDLRIGNLVLNPHSGQQHKISAMDINDIDNKVKTRTPITLTEEILLKCGFEKAENYGKFLFIELNDWTKIYVHFFNGQYAVEISVSKHCYCPPIKCLHQLQNLIYALTGQELNIEL